MSAPNTNIDKQADRHRGPLRGMFAMVLFALLLVVGLAIWAFSRGGSPEGAQAQVNDTTGEVVEENTDGPEASDNATPAAPRAEADDPSAVTVPAETVTSPQTGAGNVADTDPGESQSAEPLDPVDGEGPGNAPDEDAAAEPAGN